jgi:exopolysaccharide biosynthesis protein
VNGSYFALNGEILGLLKLDGQIVSTPTLARTALGILPDGRVLIDQVDYTGLVTLPDGRKVAISGVNHERGPDELMLYNAYFGQSTDTNKFGVDYLVVNNKIAAINREGNTLLSPGSIVLSAHGKAAAALAGLKVGDTVIIDQTLGQDWDKTRYALGAGPRLVKGSSIFITTKLEEFGSDVAGGRAPRTALGLTKAGHILLVVVDGRQAASIGQSLLELAAFMQELGAVDAMNLDGGGSSEMVVNGRTVNNPSDGHERRVGSALTVVRAPVAN